MALKLPRLPINWSEQPELFRRYWDQVLTYIESPKASTFANLPLNASAGSRGFVSDSSVITFGSLVAGGGLSYVPVYYDGLNWYVG